MDSHKDFKEKLDNEHKWPATYMFKFVVPKGKVEDFRTLFSIEDLKEKVSKAGNYISFTFQKQMKSSDEVVEVYINAKKIEGVISL